MINQPISENVQYIIDQATRLFAERGFNGVTTRDIAAAVNLSIATVHYHVGTKRELYLKVIRHLFESETNLLSGIIESADDETIAQPSLLRDLLFRLVDSFLDIMNESPARARLYIRRWLEEKDELTPTEVQLTLLQYTALRNLFQKAVDLGSLRGDIDFDFFLRSFTWMINDYFVTGSLNWVSLYSNPHDPASLQNFKQYLHTYICRMLNLNPI